MSQFEDIVGTTYASLEEAILAVTRQSQDEGFLSSVGPGACACRRTNTQNESRNNDDAACSVTAEIYLDALDTVDD
ncbi:unnamed protein product [Albugo candida]|uniref:Uncharacterized protein n=1 Tax=Albugo candida TaxID=65357 RepID=A0A024FYE1_9STRA|nr:unnamed protein product [Albugo candida]|eukprot:CCI11689.1 unnamed protein product [Albugo candida]